MKRQNVLLVLLVAVLLGSGVLVVCLWLRRGELLVALADRPPVSGALSEATPSASGDSVTQAGDTLAEVRRKVEETQKALRNLEEKRSIAQKSRKYLEKLYYPEEDTMTLEDWREAQPEEYEKLKKELAHVLRYAAAKKRLRGEYLARLDLSVLTEEEQQRLLEGLKRIAREEERLLNGDGDAELYYKARGHRSFGDLERWFYEGTTAQLAFAADWRQACGTAAPFVAVNRAIALRYWHAPDVQPRSPSFIRGTSYMLIDNPEAPDGKRLVHVKVEPGWQPE